MDVPVRGCSLSYIVFSRESGGQFINKEEFLGSLDAAGALPMLKNPSIIDEVEFYLTIKSDTRDLTDVQNKLLLKA